MTAHLCHGRARWRCSVVFEHEAIVDSPNGRPLGINVDLKYWVGWARPGWLVGCTMRKCWGEGGAGEMRLGNAKCGRPLLGAGRLFFGPSENSGITVVIFEDDSAPAFYQLVNPGENLKSGITAPQKKSGTTIVEKAGL